MWDVIIPSSLRLLLKMWIWYRYRKRKLLAPWWRIIGFYKKVQIKTQSKKLCITRTNDSKLFNKNCTQENVKCHFQHWTSDWTGKLQEYHFPLKETETFQASSDEVIVIYSEKMANYIKEHVWKLHYRLTSSQIVFRDFKYLLRF